MWNHLRIIRFLKSLIPFSFRIILIRVLVCLQKWWYWHVFPQELSLPATNKKRIFVLLSTDYANLGDHAMTYAQIQFLHEAFPDREIIEVSVNSTIKYLKSIRSQICPEDCITLKGGGNIGIEYFREELLRRLILRIFFDIRIVSFPQTIFFPVSRTGKREQSVTSRIYGKHSDFHLFLRDPKSYQLATQMLHTNKIYHVPDIALYLNLSQFENSRAGVVVCLRSDREGVINSAQKKQIEEIASKYGSVSVIDTVKNNLIDSHNREAELKRIWSIFGSSKLVVTDRLHGMIFAILTKTPCVVLQTYNHKLKSQYDCWFSELGYVKFTECAPEKVEHAIRHVWSIEHVECRLDNKQLFTSITNAILGVLP